LFLGHKRTVLRLVERGGKIRSFRINSAAREYVGSAFRQNVNPESTLYGIKPRWQKDDPAKKWADLDRAETSN
jgi:hypothetical protein